MRNVPNDASAHAVAFNIDPELQEKLLGSKTVIIAYEDGTNGENGKKKIEKVDFQFPGNKLFTFLRRCIDAKGLPMQDLN